MKVSSIAKLLLLLAMILVIVSFLPFLGDDGVKPQHPRIFSVAELVVRPPHLVLAGAVCVLSRGRCHLGAFQPIKLP